MTTRTCFVYIVAVAIALSIPASIVRAQTVYSDGPKYYGAPPPAPVGARAAAAAAATNPATAPTSAPTPLKLEELEQVVAPVALYPDSLLAQVLMASTYPLEVVQAERWVKQNPKLKDSPEALNKLTWDASVKSLLDFPQVLTMMSEKLDWTVKLGDAFLADQKAVMDAVQRLRGKAYANGNLKSGKEQTVKVEPASTTAPAGQAAAAPQVIVVESTSPSVVYVPTYNPTVVYGSWPYPSYPPYYYTPPGYVAGTALLSFGIGMACGAAWGHAWGGCNWHGGEVDIDVDRNYNFNTNINREQARANMDNRQAGRDTRQGERQTGRDTRQGERQGNRAGGASKFQHDASHRQGVAYRDQATTERFRGAQASQSSVAARDAYRGRAEAGRQELNRGAADSFRGTGGSGFGSSGAGVGGSGARAAGDYRGGVGRQPSASNYSGTRSSGFSGSNYSGSSARAASSRGQTSRSSSGYSASRGGSSYSGASRSGGYSGGGSRGGGGGMRGGGGGGGRGGGGRR